MKKKRIEPLLKGYFDTLVESRTAPPCPENYDVPAPGSESPVSHGHTGKADRVIHAALIAASILLVSLPAVNNSPIRKSCVHINQIEAFKTRVPELFYEASQEYKTSKGV